MSEAIYIRFTREGDGTRLIATEGYSGAQIVNLLWERALTKMEESELASAVRAGRYGRLVGGRAQTGEATPT